MQTLFQTAQAPKTLVLERTDDGRLRLVLGLKKLGAATMLEYFLEPDEAKGLSEALSKR